MEKKVKEWQGKNLFLDGGIETGGLMFQNYLTSHLDTGHIRNCCPIYKVPKFENFINLHSL